MKEKKVNNEQKNTKSYFWILTIIFALVYFVIAINNAFNHIEYIKEIINYIGVLIILFAIALSILGNKKVKNVFSVISSCLIILLIGFNLLIIKNILTLPVLTTVSNFTNISLLDARKWAEENNIIINIEYEYSDTVKEGYIITQSVDPNTVAKKVKTITFLVSNGPNYDKEEVLSSLVGLTIDDVLSVIEEKHLNNVNINYQVSDTEKDKVISQNKIGQIKRNEEIILYISLGNQDNLKNLEIEDLTNKTEFEATLYLKRNGIYYKLDYEFNDTIKRGNVITQDIHNKELVPLKDIITLTISKGKKIIVPNVENKTVNEIIDWASSNNLKLGFIESYSTTLEPGKLIDINYRENEVLEEDTKVILNISKGPLVFPKFNNINDFITWANKYEVTYKQENQFNDTIKKGNIIKFSVSEGEKINPQETAITVYISYGSPVFIPNTVGKNKTEIQNICKNNNLNCTFYYVGYNNTAKDVALKQNIATGTKVVSGSYLSIGLSLGPAQTFSVFLQDSLFGTTASATIQSLKEYLAVEAPGVTFNFTTKMHNTYPAGWIHPDSPIVGGQNYFTQGKTYTIIVIQ